jgi:hypothetical protein
VHLQLGDILDSNLQDSDRVKSAAALDAPPALGKSTVVNTFGRDFHRQRIAEVGEYLDEDRDILHLPVCHITVPGRLTIKGLHMMILGFYAHPRPRASCTVRWPAEIWRGRPRTASNGTTPAS